VKTIQKIVNVGIKQEKAIQIVISFLWTFLTFKAEDCIIGLSFSVKYAGRLLK